MLALAALLLSLPNAAVWVAYIRSVHAGHAWRATLWDGGIVLLSNVAVLTLWHESGNDMVVLLASMIGGMVGTFFTVRHG